MIDEGDVGVLLDELRPYLGKFAADIVREAHKLGQIPELQPATVVDTNTANGVISVVPDGGGGDPVPAATLIGIPEFGSRVMLLYQPPAGVFVVGYIGARRQPHVAGGMWRRTVSLAIPPGVTTAVSFDTETFDSDNFLPTPGSTFTVPSNTRGRYLFTATVVFQTAPPGRTFIELAASSYPFTLRASLPGSSGENVVSVSGMFNLGDGDMVLLSAFQASFASINVTGYLEAVRLLD